MVRETIGLLITDAMDIDKPFEVMFSLITVLDEYGRDLLEAMLFYGKCVDLRLLPEILGNYTT